MKTLFSSFDVDDLFFGKFILTRVFCLSFNDDDIFPADIEIHLWQETIKLVYNERLLGTP